MAISILHCQIQHVTEYQLLRRNSERELLLLKLAYGVLMVICLATEESKMLHHMV